jgi:hypothetical protein
MRSIDAIEQTIDPVMGRRIFTMCWCSAGLGVSILQMLVLAQAWSVSRQALVPAFIASAWVIGSLIGSRRRATTHMGAGCLVACALLLLEGPRLVPWRLTLLPTAWVSDGALLVIALLLGAISTAWLCQRRPWPAAHERVALARGLLGTTTGLFMVWVLPVWAGLIALACLIPLLALDYQPAGRSPLPAIGSVVESWVGRYWSTERWQLHLDQRSLSRNWWWSYRARRSQHSRRYLPLTLLASSSAVILGAVWGAMPTPLAAWLAGTHELAKLDWLLGGQLVALVIGACCMLVARDVVGLPDRLPPSWQARACSLGLSMLVIQGGSLVTLGLPLLQAPWWLALSLASYTLAGASLDILLPRLRPSLGTLMVAQRHLLTGQGRGLTDTLRLAQGRAQEGWVTRRLATTEGVLIAVLTPLVGVLIDFYGSVDRVLIIIGLCFLLMLTVSALISVLRAGDEHPRAQFTQSMSRVDYNHVRPVW